MKIGIDARFIGRPGGLGRYTEELVRSLSSRAARHEYVLFLTDDGLRALTGWSPSNVKKVRAEVPWYTLAEQLRMPAIVGREHLDLMHFPHWNVALGVRAPFVLTIHDLLILEHPTPRATTLGPLRYFLKSRVHRLVLREAIRRARAIIVPSEFVRTDVAARFPRAAAKVVVIPEGVRVTPHLNPLPQGERNDFENPPNQGERNDLGIPTGQEERSDSTIPPPSGGRTEERVLYVGNAYPHKNLERLIQAFIVVHRDLPQATLTIAGYDDYFFRRTERFADESGAGEFIQFIPSPGDDTLETLYREAGLFIIPSLSEGFGLTPLEAMARRVPVAAAARGSLPEVLGDAAAYFNPEDVVLMAATISRLLADDRLRQELITKGFARAGQFSWDEAARQTIAIYAQEGNKAGT